MTALITFVALLLAFGLTYSTNWLALNPWRRSKEKHWSEQARLVYPVLVAAQSNLLMVPGIFALVVVLVWPDASLLWFFTGTAALLGAYVGMLPAIREVYPRIRTRELLEQLLVGILLRFPVWFIFIMAAVFMPDEPNGATLFLGLYALVIVAAWKRFGAWVARGIGVVRPAPERLRKIAEAASAKMGIKFKEVLLVRSPTAQAFALIGSGKLLFTERLLELLPDDEVAAICAHELAHLTEPKTARISRSIRLLMFLPWIFFKPVLHSFGMIGFLSLCFTTVFVPKIYRSISHKLESRADQMAKTNEGDAGTYARALARLYQDNLAPAVNAKEKATHPHLYDRLLAAGVTPDFPRPVASSTMAWHGSLFAGLAGILFALFAIKIIQTSASG